MHQSLALRPAVQPLHGCDVGGLQAVDGFVVAIGHGRSRRTGMVKAEGMTDLVCEGVPEVVDIQMSVKSDLPAQSRIEADERPLDRHHDAGLDALESRPR